MTAYVLGIDLAMSAPGAVALPVDWRPGDHVMAWKLNLRGAVGERAALKRYLYIGDWVQNIVSAVSCARPGQRLGKKLRGVWISETLDWKLSELSGVIRAQLLGVWGIVAERSPLTYLAAYEHGVEYDGGTAGLAVARYGLSVVNGGGGNPTRTHQSTRGMKKPRA